MTDATLNPTAPSHDDGGADPLNGDRDAPRVESVRGAIREDVAEARAWVRERAERAQEAVRDDPIRATLYALGAGVLIGLLMRR